MGCNSASLRLCVSAFSSFDTLVGNEPIKKRLTNLLSTNRVPHLLLFAGPEGAGKRLFATAFAQEWLHQISEHFSPQGTLEDPFHPDLQLLRPEGKTGMLSIQSVRNVIENLHLSPYEAGGRAVIIDDAERMLPTSANALLKVLEEPPKNTLIILVSSRPEKILSTIRSRSQLMRFRPRSDAMSPSLDPELEKLMFDLLIDLKHKNFADLATSCQEIQKIIDTRCEGKEAALKEDIAQVSKEMSASAKELLENEIAGIVTLFRLNDTEKLLWMISAFYRDLVAIGANNPTLYFSHRKEAMIEGYNQGRGVALDRVDKLLKWAKQAIERYQPLQNVLETLFLQL
ncbi:MAG: AAA family ATPase [Verrucomicrobia bacterium]|nr:AAA family ATPase [Verrucomicrobiota bacterium]